MMKFNFYNTFIIIDKMLYVVAVSVYIQYNDTYQILYIFNSRTFTYVLNSVFVDTVSTISKKSTFELLNC